mmetsp:Transcript_21630/g.60144  ORF Transcript_21630/g.60144 Transcript_21630/m.60144 type:complete len:785 (+) Transcript_21630:318-2672(+)
MTMKTKSIHHHHRSSTPSRGLLWSMVAAGGLGLLPCVVKAASGNREPMIRPMEGWEALEIISEGDNPTGWEIPDEMDGVGAFLVPRQSAAGDLLRVHVNHEDDGEATISEINLNKGRLKEAISDILGSVDRGKNDGYDFVESARVAYDRWSSDGGSSWRNIGADIRDAEDAGGFCRFCSSQYYPANAFGKNRGFTDSVYLTGEECWDDGGRFFALDLHDNFRDLYQVSGFTGSMPLSNAGGDSTGYGGMPFDSWENAALIDTGETDHVALFLSADGGSETLRVYIGKKFTAPDGSPDKINFLARNGLAYGRWFYLGGDMGWEENPLWMTTEPGRFVTDFDDAWRESKFEDIDTDPTRPSRAALAVSNSGVYVVDFQLVFDAISGGFVPGESSFSARMVAGDDNDSSKRNPDNVDWTKNNLIFINKDNDEGGVWYMNPDGSNKVKIGETRDDGESTGILDVSELLDYPPASAMITTNQGSPSSMTLLLNPELGSFLASAQSATQPPVQQAPTTPPVPAPNQAPVPAPTPEAVPPPPIAPTTPPIAPIVADYDSTQTCPEGDVHGLFRVYQAEDALLYSAWIKSKSKHFCGDGYVDFSDDITEPYFQGNFDAVPTEGKIPVFANKDGILSTSKNRNQNDNSSKFNGIAVSRSDRNDWKERERAKAPGSRRATVGISFHVDIAFVGIYKVSIRYANGGDLNTDRPGLFLVDGDFVEKDGDNSSGGGTGNEDYTFGFLATYGWNIWAVESKTVTFDTIGIHTLDLIWTQTMNRPNLDWLSVELLGNHS